MLIAAAVCPHPPLLVPDMAGAAAAELDALRAECDAAVTALAAAEPELIVVAGGAAQAAEFDGSAAGSLAGYGVSWQTGAGTPVLPLSLTIGRWLLQRGALLGVTAAESGAWPPATARAGPAGGAAGGLVDGPPRVLLRAVPMDAPPRACLRLGAQIAGRASRVALLAMGDGSARCSAQAPGAFDVRARPYGAEVAAALADADAGRLARLDPGLPAELLAAGRAAWQVLAGAAGNRSYRGRQRYVSAPYGVSYLVASWTAAAATLAHTR